MIQHANRQGITVWVHGWWSNPDMRGFIGEENMESERAIVEMGQVRRLGRLPHLDPLDALTLRTAFDSQFRRTDFAAEMPS